MDERKGSDTEGVTQEMYVKRQMLDGEADWHLQFIGARGMIGQVCEKVR